MIAQSYLDFQAEMLHPKICLFLFFCHKNKISRYKKKSLSKWGRINEIWERIFNLLYKMVSTFQFDEFFSLQNKFYLPDLTSLSLTPSSALSSLHSAAAAVYKASKLAQAKKSHAVNLEK